MKRYIMFLLVAGAMVASCSTQDLDIPSTGGESVSGVLDFSATMVAKSPLTKAVDADGKATWELKEEVAVYYQKSDGSYDTAIATVVEVNTGKAIINAQLTDVMNGGTVKFVYPASMVNATGDDIDASKLGTQHGTISDISKNFDAATGESTIMISGTTCHTKGTVTLTNQLLIGKFTPVCGDKAIDSITSLIINDGSNTYTVTPSEGTFDTNGIYVAMLPVEKKEITITAEADKKNYFYDKEDITLSAGKLYNNLSVKMMMRYDLASASFAEDADAYIFQSDSDKKTTSNTITIANGRKVLLAGVNMLVSGNAINCLGDAEIVLNGTNIVKSKNTSSGDNNKAIIRASSNPETTLTFSGSGTLDVRTDYDGSWMGAFIGSDKNGKCGNITITGGTITAIAYKEYSNYKNSAAYGAIIGAGSANGGTSSCGNIYISGGTVTIDTHKGSGAGIGSGTSESTTGYSTCGTITICGGNVSAISQDGGAAIGTGGVNIYQQNPSYNGYSKCEGILIGGTASVTATSKSNDSSKTAKSGAAIGTGNAGQVGYITISGGTVKATAVRFAAGIGAGRFRSTCGDILISGGTIEATGGEKAAGIGTTRGLYKCVSTCGNITITTGVTSVKAIMGSQGNRSIGNAATANDRSSMNPYYCKCGTVTIGGTVQGSGGVSTSPYTYIPTK